MPQFCETIFCEAQFSVHLKESLRPSLYVPYYYHYHSKYCANTEYFLNKEEKEFKGETSPETLIQSLHLSSAPSPYSNINILGFKERL